MEYTTLSSTGMEVNRICLGGMSFGVNDLHEWTLDEEGSREIIERATNFELLSVETEADSELVEIPEDVS